MRIVPVGFNPSTCVVTSKLAQSLAAAVVRANGRHVLFSRGNARAAETAAVEERKSRRFMVSSKLPLLGSNQDSPDPESSRAGLFGGHHVRKWLPAKHRRPQAWKLMPGLARRNACKMLAKSSGRLS